MPYKEVWIDDDLEDFSNEDLIVELEARGYRVHHENDILYKLRQEYLLSSPEQFRKFVEKMLDDNGMPI